jgi:hypothetical protein
MSRGIANRASRKHRSGIALLRRKIVHGDRSRCRVRPA